MRSIAVAEKLGGSEVLHREVRTELDLVALLRQGLPPGAADALLGGGSVTAEELYRLVIPRRTLALRKQRDQSLTADESDRLARVARILAAADDTFGDPGKTARWLRRPNRGLGGEVPLDLLTTETGARLVEGALGRLTHGIFA